MEALNLHCPSCGAIVDVPDDIDTFYCSHCGTKLIISGQDKNTLDAKVRLRIAEKKLEYDDKERARRFELDKKKHEDKDLLLTLIVVAIIVIGEAIISNFIF